MIYICFASFTKSSKFIPRSNYVDGKLKSKRKSVIKFSSAIQIPNVLLRVFLSCVNRNINVTTICCCCLIYWNVLLRIVFSPSDLCFPFPRPKILCCWCCFRKLFLNIIVLAFFSYVLTIFCIWKFENSFKTFFPC